VYIKVFTAIYDLKNYNIAWSFQWRYPPSSTCFTIDQNNIYINHNIYKVIYGRPRSTIGQREVTLLVNATIM